MTTENDAYVFLLSIHLSAIIERLRAIPPDKWDWAPAPAAPSARIVGEHTWVWLVCDRQHLSEPDTTRHSPIPHAPVTMEALCDALEAENRAWCDMLAALTPEQFAEDRCQFGTFPLDVRQFVAHITQQVIYKSGQLSTIFFALGLDGDEPYTAPHPNDGYIAQSELLAQPLHAAILTSNMKALNIALSSSEPSINLSIGDQTPLSLAVMRNLPEMVSALLQHGADCDQKSSAENTALISAAYFGRPEIVKLLIGDGADVNASNKWGRSPLSVARKQKHEGVVDLLVAAGAMSD